MAERRPDGEKPGPWAGLFIGAWAGGLLAATVMIAVNSSYQAQTLAGGDRLSRTGVIVLIVIGVVLGGLVGALVEANRG